MTTLDEAIVAFLAATQAVAAICADRIYPGMLPQKVSYPSMTVRRISTPREYSFGGASGLASPRFQFDCCALDKAGAKGLADAVRAAFDGRAVGTVMGGAAGVLVHGCFAEDERDTDFSDGTQLVRCVQLDVQIWHAE